MRKYQSVEKAEVLPPKEQDQIAARLAAVTGKRTAKELTETERKLVFGK